jgi:hypothetical protein
MVNANQRYSTRKPLSSISTRTRFVCTWYAVMGNTIRPPCKNETCHSNQTNSNYFLQPGKTFHSLGSRCTPPWLLVLCLAKTHLNAVNEIFLSAEMPFFPPLQLVPGENWWDVVQIPSWMAETGSSLVCWLHLCHLNLLFVLGQDYCHFCITGRRDMFTPNTLKWKWLPSVQYPLFIFLYAIVVRTVTKMGNSILYY